MKSLPARMKRIALLVLMFLVSTVFGGGISKVALPKAEIVRGSTTAKCGNRLYDSLSLNSSHFQQNRIVNGEQASYGEFPWQVSIDLVLQGSGAFDQRIRNCGASIISEFWLLSAAHCFEGYHPTTYEVTAGNHDRRKPDHAEQIFQVDDIIKHEQYRGKSTGFDYDIALIKIKLSTNGRGIQFNSFVQPVCLPDSTTSYKEGNTCIVSGWGTTKDPNYDLNPAVLMKSELKLVDRQKCQQMSLLYPITDRMLCAGDLQGHTGTCFGDSGGGLVYKDKGSYTLLGIVSWGDNGCNVPNKPGVFADVLNLLPWIKSTIHRYSDFCKQHMLPTRP